MTSAVSFKVQQFVLQLRNRITVSFIKYQMTLLARMLGCVAWKLCLFEHLTLRTVWCSHLGRLPGTAGSPFLAPLHSEVHAVFPAYAPGSGRAMESSGCSCFPFSFSWPSLPLTSWLPFSSSLLPPPSLSPWPFPSVFYVKKCKIECLYKDYVMHFHCASGRGALSGQYYYAAHRTTDIFSARRELEITPWSSF